METLALPVVQGNVTARGFSEEAPLPGRLGTETLWHARGVSDSLLSEGTWCPKFSPVPAPKSRPDSSAGRARSRPRLGGVGPRPQARPARPAFPRPGAAALSSHGAKLSVSLTDLKVCLR